VIDDVDAREIRRTKRRRLRPTRQNAGQHVDVVDRKVVLFHHPDRQHHSIDAEAVRDKSRNVVRDDDSLPEHPIAEPPNGVKRFFGRRRRRNDFQ